MESQDHELSKALTDFVDYLMPELTAYETTMYVLLLRKSFVANEARPLRIGKRTLCIQYGKGITGASTHYETISKQLDSLNRKGCIEIGDTTREGTLYTIVLPQNIPLVAEKLSRPLETLADDDYFTAAEKRKVVFERDDWTCFYCGEKLTPDNATLDHFHPQHIGGTHAKENLRTSCLMCNSIKSGKSYDEAAPLILRSMQERRRRKLNQ